MIDRYAILSAVVGLAADCLNDPADTSPCAYRTFVGLGAPPSDCSLISANWSSDRVLSRGDRCHVTIESAIDVHLTRCCLTNVDEEFSAAAEDTDAACFLAEYDKLMDCLLCEVKALVKQHGFNCDDPLVDGAMTDAAVSGGCYSGRFSVTFRWIRKCC